MSGAPNPLVALVEALDDDTLDALAKRLAPRLRGLAADREPDRYMSTAEAARYLGMSTHALHRLTAARTIPFAQERPGARCYFRRSTLDEWREQQARGGRDLLWAPRSK